MLQLAELKEGLKLVGLHCQKSVSLSLLWISNIHQQLLTTICTESMDD